MTNPMDVDKEEEGTKTISIHPLSIVSMADHFTRVTTGGTPLNPKAPVVGILFGVMDDDHRLHVTDAEDIPLNANSQAQVSLHQAVFPQHEVVGWYRVSQGEGPVPEDVPTNQQLQTQYASHQLIFLHLQVQTTNKTSPAPGNETSDDDDADADIAEDAAADGNANDADDELPVTIFTFDEQAFVNVAHWSLNTKDAERIAIERVVREQPQNNHENLFVSKSKAARESLEALQTRVQIIQNYLQAVQTGSTPPTPGLLRRIQTVLGQLGLVPASSTEPKNLLELAILAKTVQQVCNYTENLRLSQITKAGVARPPPGRDRRSATRTRSAAENTGP